MNRNAILVAGAIALALVLWLASGHLARDRVDAPLAEQAPPERLFTVQAELREARPVTRSLTLQGQTEPNRAVMLRAETAGPITELPVERGERVEPGQVIARLAPGERASRLRQAEAQLAQREIAYEAARGLADEGFQAAIETRQAFAALQAAEAEVEAAREALRQTLIRAPFGGVLNNRLVELGAYVSAGSEIGTLIDAQPLLIRVDVPQQQIGRLASDSRVQARLAGQRVLTGHIRFISVSADTGTRTFPVEIEIDNADGRIPAGISAEVDIALDTVPAHFISPALLSLDAAGTLGVKTVDDDDRVLFHPVAMVRSQPDGVWVSGLPQAARLITIGQGYVEPGQRVRVQMAAEENGIALGARP